MFANDKMLFVMDKSNKIKRICFSGVMCVMIFVLTCIAIPVGGGNLNLGDCGVLFSGFLPIPYGLLAACIGSVLSDLVLGYSIYIPCTLIGKSLTSLLFGLLNLKKSKGNGGLGLFFSGLFSIIPQILLYFAYDYFLYKSFITALYLLAFNAVQALAGILLMMIIYKFLPVKFRETYFGAKI